MQLRSLPVVQAEYTVLLDGWDYVYNDEQQKHRSPSMMLRIRGSFGSSLAANRLLDDLVAP